MRTDVCRQLGIEYPIFAFSHCRDVVAAVSRAGGMGVLGVSRHSPAELVTDLKWIREQSRGAPFGVDLVFPTVKESSPATDAEFPPEHVAFVQSLVERFRLPPPADTESARQYSAHKLTTENFVELAQVALDFGIALMVSALGLFPEDVSNGARSRGVLLGALVGSPRHASKQLDAGIDLLIAQGQEAGGHVGRTSTMVLVPQVVDMAGDRPVLAAGGIADGRQVAAAMALGAQGVWLGSAWLTTIESDLQPRLVDRLLDASSDDTVVSRSYSGKPVRLLRTPWVEAWESESAPTPLPTPFQGLLVRDAMTSAVEHGIEDVLGTPLGETVGMLHRRQNCDAVVFDLVQSFVQAGQSLATLLAADE
jgi:NAD(P)H-dependent flavin oxidoreductase YrpB (nitropropane dioxygenase family)